MTPPDFSKCAAKCVEGYRVWQCKNTPKYDPDEDGKPTTCHVHRDQAPLLTRELGTVDRYGWTLVKVEKEVRARGAYATRSVTIRVLKKEREDGLTLIMKNPAKGSRSDVEVSIWRDDLKIDTKRRFSVKWCRDYAESFDFRAFAEREIENCKRVADRKEAEVACHRKRAYSLGLTLERYSNE